MSDEDEPGHEPGMPTIHLIDEYRQKRDAVSSRRRELARGRREVVSAVEREAMEVVANTRAAVRTAISNARRQLSGLAVQIEAITDTSEQPSPAPGFLLSTADGDDAQSRIVGERHELRAIAIDARSELDGLFDATVGGPAMDEYPADHVPDQFRHGDAPPTETTPDSRPLTTDIPLAEPMPAQTSQYRTRAMWAVAFIAVVVAVLGVAWNSRMRRTVSPRVTRSASANPISARAEPAHTAPVTAPIAAPLRPLSVSLVIEAQRPVWIQATIDGRTEPGGIMPAGQKREISGEHEVSLRIGDAGAVRASLNGGESAVLGRDGQVLTRRFALDPERSTPQGKADAPERLDKPAPNDTPSHAAAGAASPAASVAPLDPAARRATSAAIIDAGERWLRAYYRQDAEGMAAAATPETTIADSRTAGERLPPGLTYVRVTLEQADVQIAGDSAILSGRLMEQAVNEAAAPPIISWVSQVWMRSGSRWRLMDVRIVSNAKLR